MQDEAHLVEVPWPLWVQHLAGQLLVGGSARPDAGQAAAPQARQDAHHICIHRSHSLLAANGGHRPAGVCPHACTTQAALIIACVSQGEVPSLEGEVLSLEVGERAHVLASRAQA